MLLYQTITHPFLRDILGPRYTSAPSHSRMGYKQIRPFLQLVLVSSAHLPSLRGEEKRGNVGGLDFATAKPALWIGKLKPILCYLPLTSLHVHAYMA